MMQLGVRAHDFGKLPIDDLARRVAAHGLCAVQFAAPKSIPGFDDDAGRLSPGLAIHARETLRAHGVAIAVLGCYINLGTPDEAAAAHHLRRFKDYLRHARDFGCGIVATETGSVNADFSFHPDNHGEAAYQRVLRRMRELAAAAERFGVCVCVEAVSTFVIHSPARVRRLLDDVGSDNLQVLFDPVNLLNADNHRRQDALIEESFALFADRMAVFHAKDFVITPDGRCRQAAAGAEGGLLNYPLFFKLAKKHKPFAQILLEDTTPATLPRAAAFARAAWEKV